MSTSRDIKRETAHWAQMMLGSQEQALEVCEKIERLTTTAIAGVRQSAEGYTAAGQTVFVNNGWKELWRMEPADVKSYNMLKDENLHSKETWPAIRAGFSGTPGDTPPAIFNPTEIGLPGRERCTDGYISPVLNSEQETARVILLLRDVTDVKMAFGEIRDLRNQLQQLQFQYESIAQRLDELALGQPMARLIDLPASRQLRSAATRLSARERQVFAMLARDKTVKEIAYDLGIDSKSVYTYRARLMTKLKLQSSLQLAAAYAELQSELQA